MIEKTTVSRGEPSEWRLWLRRTPSCLAPSRAMAARGFLEAVTWSFMAKEHAGLFGKTEEALTVANPVASELNYMRPSALGNLAQAAQRAANRGERSIRIFEAGPVYLGDGPKDQRTVIAGLVQPAAQRHWQGAPQAYDAFAAKADLLALLAALGQSADKFQIGPATLPLDGSTPTLLYGYGGFEIPLVPGYEPIAGAAWLEKGRVYVIANIRGGGEFGPTWHQAALKAKRPRAYEDFIAVAEDLVARKVTSKKHLGIKGGSNGGLLVGNMLAMRPDLFGAVVCQVPLLDMRRYHTLLAGASWMDEYGNPDDPEQWAFMKAFSPYHLVAANKGPYPPTLITTSTRDDRVHPGHARKMTARLLAIGAPVLYYENIEGGHGGAADNRQKAFMDALGYAFLDRELR